MNIYITVKSTNKKKNYITQQLFTISEHIDSLRKLLCELTSQMVEAYMKKEIDADLVSALTEEQIKSGQETGKVGFNRRFGEGKVKKDEAIETMLLAFEDGLFRVFINEEEITGLDKHIEIKDGDKVLLIRFIMLAGSFVPYL